MRLTLFADRTDRVRVRIAQAMSAMNMMDQSLREKARVDETIISPIDSHLLQLNEVSLYAITTAAPLGGGDLVGIEFVMQSCHVCPADSAICHVD